MESITIFNTNKIKISKIILGLISNNVYFIESENDKCIIDPSCRPDEIINTFGKKINKMILTHYHFDHIGAAKDIKNATNCKVYASEVDAPIIEQKQPIPTKHRRVEAVGVDVILQNKDQINIGYTQWRVIDTPGHTPGSICLYCSNTESNNILIAGDTLFYQSCGRTDFIDGNPQDMHKSLNKLSELENDTLVLPGHGEETTIGYEKNFMLGNSCIF